MVVSVRWCWYEPSSGRFSPSLTVFWLYVLSVFSSFPLALGTERVFLHVIFLARVPLSVPFSFQKPCNDMSFADVDDGYDACWTEKCEYTQISRNTYFFAASNNCTFREILFWARRNNADDAFVFPSISFGVVVTGCKRFVVCTHRTGNHMTLTYGVRLFPPRLLFLPSTRHNTGLVLV